MSAPDNLYHQIIATQEALRSVILELQDQVLKGDLSDTAMATSFRAHELLHALRQLLARSPDEASKRATSEDADSLELVVETLDRALHTIQ